MDRVQGEGNYDAAREYDDKVSTHAADRDRVKQDAATAKKAVEGSEREALEEAEAKGRSHARR